MPTTKTKATPTPPLGRHNEVAELRVRLAEVKARLPKYFVSIFFDKYPEYKKNKQLVYNVNVGKVMNENVIEKFEELATQLERFYSENSNY